PCSATSTNTARSKPASAPACPKASSASWLGPSNAPGTSPCYHSSKMADYTPAGWVKHIDNQVDRLLRQIDWAEVGEKGRKAVEQLRQNLADARIYSQDYELSEMREEQIDNAKKAKKWLDKAHQQILRA